MKKTLLLVTASIVALGAAVPALAADLPARVYTKAPPVAMAAYGWSGFYAGINGGGGWAHSCWNVVGGLSEGCHNADGGTVGGQVGYRWQMTNWVFVVEAQGDWADLKGSNTSSLAALAPLVTLIPAVLAVTISGMDSLDVLRQNLRVARGFAPMTAAEMQALRDRCAKAAGDGRHEVYKLSLRFDNPQARWPHGFPLDATQKEVQEMLFKEAGGP